MNKLKAFGYKYSHFFLYSMKYFDLKIKNDQSYDYTHWKFLFKCYKFVNFVLKQKLGGGRNSPHNNVGIVYLEPFLAVLHQML